MIDDSLLTKEVTPLNTVLSLPEIFAQSNKHIKDTQFTRPIKNDEEVQEMYLCLHAVIGLIQDILRTSHRVLVYQYGRFNAAKYEALTRHEHHSIKLIVFNDIISDVHYLIGIIQNLSEKIIQYDDNASRKEIFNILYESKISPYLFSCEEARAQSIANFRLHKNSVNTEEILKAYFKNLEYMYEIYTDVNIRGISSSLDALLQNHRLILTKNAPQNVDFVEYIKYNDVIHLLIQFTGKDITDIIETKERNKIFQEMIKNVKQQPLIRRLLFIFLNGLLNTNFMKKIL